MRQSFSGQWHRINQPLTSSKSLLDGMKVLIILVCLCAAFIAQVAVADDVRASNSPAQPAAPPVPSASAARSNSGEVRRGMRSNPNVRRTIPAPTQPIRRPVVATSNQGALRDRLARQTVAYSQRRNQVKTGNGSLQQPNTTRLNFADAARRHRSERHDCNWWKKHFTIIVFVSTGYYYWDAGYWYPAWGYDPAYDYYEYNGPIYTYGNLLPDQVVVNVQSALQEEGYYFGTINGSLGPSTRAAIANYQRDHGLIVTAAIDQPTIEALGLE